MKKSKRATYRKLLETNPLKTRKKINMYKQAKNMLCEISRMKNEENVMKRRLKNNG